MGVKPNMTEEQAREEVERRIQFICDYLKPPEAAAWYWASAVHRCVH